MPRSLNLKCLECSRLSIEQAIEQHGESGDGCWNPAVCHRKRSHYRNRPDVNAKRRGQRVAEQELQKLMQVGEVPFTERLNVVPKTPPVALLYLYREDRPDAHLHAIAISVWQGDQKLAVIPPKHCIGMANRHVRQYLLETLATLQEKYGIREFEPEILMHPKECPINPCPLRGL
ncbi:hypothetical protein H6F87_26175 [Cyanobacteria bacterium FACHB-502]|nr:hypothetical protein [Cyanobacteria bacterium FACHB-502]